MRSFDFSDPDGVELDEVANTANPGNMWTVDFANLFPAEVGGVYKITKDNDTTAAAVLNIANVATGKRYIAVDMAGWAFRGFDAAEPEELRFGFLDNDDGLVTGNLVTAQMQLRRIRPTQAVELFGDASARGATCDRAPLRRNWRSSCRPTSGAQSDEYRNRLRRWP